MTMEQYRRTRPEKKNDQKLGQWERLQLGRLLFVLVLFLVIFVGKRACPTKMLAAGERVVDVLSRNMDVEAVFARLGESVTGENGALEGLETFCVEVFGSLDTEETKSVEEAMILPPVFPAAHSGLLEERLEEIRLSERVVSLPQEQRESVPAVGTVLYSAESSDTALPEGFTADKLSLGALETVNPVTGRLNSGYGYRHHPINGTYCFHGGADISAGEGDPIGAFADGVVEYIGEDDSYGLYIQLDHGDGIKSFYAHCKKLCADKGQRVEAGETIATVGATGTATGPHLHLELKCSGMRVDPAHYVDLL